MTATATAEIDEKQLVAKPQTVLYRSGRDDLRLVKKRGRTIRDPTTGELIGTTERQIIPFRNKALEFPLEGPVELQDTSDAGTCVIDSVELQEWLDGHKLNGAQYEGFWRVSVTAPAPSRVELDRLMEAAWDEEMLVSIIEQEREGWARPDLINVAETALARLREFKQAAEAEAAAKARGEQG